MIFTKIRIMKALIISCAFSIIVISNHRLVAQVAISENGTAIHASAMLDIQSDNPGLLVPRLETTQQVIHTLGQRQ